MKPNEVLQDYFGWTTVKEIHKLLEEFERIALVTDNLHFDMPEERKKLYEFKEGLIDCIEAASKIAGK